MCPATYAKPLTRLWATVSRAIARIGHRRPSFGAAQTPPALPLRKADGRPLTLAELGQLRQALNRDWTRARARMDMRACGQIAKDAREVTHAILSNGVYSNE